MEDELIIGTIIAIYYGQRILAVIFPTAARSASAYLAFGALQVATGLLLSVGLALTGRVWQWPLVIAVYGSYDVWRGWNPCEAVAAPVRSGQRFEQKPKWHRLGESRVIVLDIPNPRAHRPHSHILRRIRGEHCP